MYEQIAANRRRSVILVASAFLLLGAVGYALGYLYRSGPGGAVVALAVAGVMSIGSYRYGDRIVLASTRAREVTPEEEPRLHNVVEGLAIAAGVPKPRVYIVPEAALNAFATGRDPEHSSIAVTQGLLDSLDRLELEGVIGHEMSHIVNRDILVNTLVATLVGAVVLISELFMRSMWWGGFGGRRDDRNAGPLQGILAIVGILMLILAPFIAQMVKLAVSRQREYLADANGALLTRYPPGLVSALRKIQATSGIPMRAANDATAHLWLNHPSRFEGERTGFLEKLYMTHPPIGDRIARLEDM